MQPDRRRNAPGATGCGSPFPSTGRANNVLPGYLLLWTSIESRLCVQIHDRSARGRATPANRPDEGHTRRTVPPRGGESGPSRRTVLAVVEVANNRPGRFVAVGTRVRPSVEREASGAAGRPYCAEMTSSMRAIIVAASVADSTASRLTAAGSRMPCSTGSPM